MNTKPAIRLIKKDKVKNSANPVQSKPADSRSWSKAVRSWIDESQQNNREESLAAFANLFK